MQAAHTGAAAASGWQVSSGCRQAWMSQVRNRRLQCIECHYSAQLVDFRSTAHEYAHWQGSFCCTGIGAQQANKSMHAVTTITTIDAATSHETAGLAWGILLMQQMLVFALCQ